MTDNANTMGTGASLPAQPPDRHADRRLIFLAMEFLIGTAVALLLGGYRLDGQAGMNLVSVFLCAIACTAVGDAHIRSDLHALFSQGNFVFYQIPMAAAFASLQLYCAGRLLGLTGMTTLGLLMFPMCAFSLWLVHRDPVSKVMFSSQPAQEVEHE